LLESRIGLPAYLDKGGAALADLGRPGTGAVERGGVELGQRRVERSCGFFPQRRDIGPRISIADLRRLERSVDGAALDANHLHRPEHVAGNIGDGEHPLGHLPALERLLCGQGEGRHQRRRHEPGDRLEEDADRQQLLHVAEAVRKKSGKGMHHDGNT
jgi:hypothetical protein